MSEFQMEVLFPFISVGIYLLIEFVFDNSDDDDDQGGGLMTPVYVPSS